MGCQTVRILGGKGGACRALFQAADPLTRLRVFVNFVTQNFVCRDVLYHRFPSMELASRGGVVAKCSPSFGLSHFVHQEGFGAYHDRSPNASDGSSCPTWFQMFGGKGIVSFPCGLCVNYTYVSFD